jgi:Peptidase C13 family
VITAADSDHSSFGCQDKVKWTYFGDAFFNTALPHTADLRSAFAAARTLVRRRELRYGLTPSNPQIAGGKNIDILLGERAAAPRRPVISRETTRRAADTPKPGPARHHHCCSGNA